MTSHPIDTETIHTAAGDYILDFYVEENADQPCNPGFTLLVDGGKNRIDILEGDTTSDASQAVQNVLATGYRPNGEISGAAIVRYLRLVGKKGVTLVDDDYTPYQGTADRNVNTSGVAWAPDDASDPDEYTRSVLQQWKAWANGDAFGWKLIDPSGAEVDSCWGYYGLNDNSENSDRAYVLETATELAEADAQDRIDIASRVGAGILGII